MDTAEQAAAQVYGTVLLEGAVGFARTALEAMVPFEAGLLFAPTPCSGWELWMLLRHVQDSLDALHEAVDTGAVRLEAVPDCAESTATAADPAAPFRGAAVRLLEVWTAAGRDDRVVTVGGSPVRAGVVAGAGAIEITVHAWDIARTCGPGVAIPPILAARLLRIAPMLAPDDDRGGLFGPPVEVPAAAPPGDRLLAFLGRDPGG